MGTQFLDSYFGDKLNTHTLASVFCLGEEWREKR